MNRLAQPHRLIIHLLVFSLAATSLRAELKSWTPKLEDRKAVPITWMLDTSTATQDDAARLSTRIYGHGFGWQAGSVPLHHPIILKTSSSTAKVLAFQVTGVSSYGADLYITVDGKPYARKTWGAHTGAGANTLFYLELPPGNHDVRLLEASGGAGEGVITISGYYLGDAVTDLPTDLHAEELTADLNVQPLDTTGYRHVQAGSLAAVYYEGAAETYFVYGANPTDGSGPSEIRAGVISNSTRRVERPTLLATRQGSLNGDMAIAVPPYPDDHVWIFVGNGGNPSSPGTAFRSSDTKSIGTFDLAATLGNFTSPHAWFGRSGQGNAWLLLFNPSPDNHNLLFKTSSDGIKPSKDGTTWSPDQPLTSFPCQVSLGDLSNQGLGLFFVADAGLFYAQTKNMGVTWTNAAGQPLTLPLATPQNPARISDLPDGGKDLILTDIAFDIKGRPTLHYVTGHGTAAQKQATHFDGTAWVRDPATPGNQVAGVPVLHADDPFYALRLEDDSAHSGSSLLSVSDSTGAETHQLPEDMPSESAPLPSPSDAAFAAADALLSQGKTGDAITAYRTLLARADFPAEFRPLILMRIARAQFAAGDKDAAGQTLKEILALPMLPEHHRLAATELAAAIAGHDPRTDTRTPLPDWGKPALTLQVGKGEKFETFTAALAEARRQRVGGSLPPGPVELVATGTEIAFDGTLELTKDDCDQRNPLILRAADPAHPPQVSGGVPLTQWTVEKDPAILAILPENARGKVLRADLKAAGVPPTGPLMFGGFASMRVRTDKPNYRFLTAPVPELFYNDVAAPMACWPKTGYSSVHYTPSTDPNNPALENVQDDEPKKWTQEKDLWLHGYWSFLWADNYEKVRRVEGDTVFLEPPINHYGLGLNKWYALNALSELSEPGEWQLDTATQIVRYFPPDNFDPGKIVFSARQPFLKADGCSFLRVDGLDLRYYRGDAIVLNDCSDTAISRCSISACSGFGIIITGGVRHLIHTVDIHNMGRGGIDIQSGDWKTFVPSESVIENCRISDLSRIDRTYTQAILAGGYAITIRHNFFENMPSSAIRLEAGGSLVELNEFTDCVTESNDQGSVELFGNPFYFGNIIRWNWFHDNRGTQPNVAAVRFDDNISGQLVWGNLIVRSSGYRGSGKLPFGGVQINGGMGNFIEENLFVDSDRALTNNGWGDQAHQMSWTQPRYAKLHDEVPWQSPAWQQRYPQVNGIVNGPYDVNFFAANTIYNARTPFDIGSRSRLHALNNAFLDSDTSPTVTFKDVCALLPPWSDIPLQEIGNYPTP